MSARALFRGIALVVLLLPLTACGRGSETAGGDGTSGGERPLLRGLDLAGPETVFAAQLDVKALRNGPLGPLLEGVLESLSAVSENAGILYRGAAESDMISIFGAVEGPRLDVVLVIEGDACASLVEHGVENGALELVGQYDDVAEFTIETMQVAFRAPDTLVIAGSAEDDDLGPHPAWPAVRDRLAGRAPAGATTELAALRDALGPSGSMAWVAVRWNRELQRLAVDPSNGAEGEAVEANAEQLLGQIAGFAAVGDLGERLRIRGLVRGHTGELAHAAHLIAHSLLDSPPSDEPVVAEILSAVETHVEGKDFHISLELPAERVGELVGQGIAAFASPARAPAVEPASESAQ